MKYVIVFLIAFLSYPSFAQSKKINFKKAWHAKVYLLERSETQGIFYHTTDSSLVILTGASYTDTTHIAANTIYKIEIRKLNSVKRNTLIGATTGFTIGFAIGWSDYDSQGVSTLQQTGHGLGGALIGGFIGAFVGHVSSSFSKTFLITGHVIEYQRIRPQLVRYHFHSGR